MRERGYSAGSESNVVVCNAIPNAGCLESETGAIFFKKNLILSSNIYFGDFGLLLNLIYRREKTKTMSYHGQQLTKTVESHFICIYV